MPYTFQSVKSMEILTDSSKTFQIMERKVFESKVILLVFSPILIVEIFKLLKINTTKDEK